MLSRNILHVKMNFRYKSLYKMWVLRIPPADTPPFPSSMSAHTKITTDIRPNAIPPMWVNLYRALSTTQLNIKTVGMEKQSSSWKKKYNFIRFFSQKKAVWLQILNLRRESLLKGQKSLQRDASGFYLGAFVSVQCYNRYNMILRKNSSNQKALVFV